MPPSSSSITIFFFFFLCLLFPKTFASDVEGNYYTACAPFNCGNFSNISYPFWQNDQPEYCGHPKFKLDCQEEISTIEIMTQKFQIIDINSKSQLLKIARWDLLNDSCPESYTNVNLDSAFFNLTSNDDNYTLLYGCGPPPYTSNFNFDSSVSFTCPNDGGVNSDAEVYLVFNKNLANFDVLGCKNRIAVPVQKGVFQSAMKGNMNGGDVLNEGFEVKWGGVDGEKCDGCLESGGRCGHNASSNEFVCFCPNQQQSFGEICGKSLSVAQSPLSPPTITQKSPQELLPQAPEYSGKEQPQNDKDNMDWERKIIIGVVSAVVGALAVIFLVFVIWRRRKKNSYAKSYIQSQSQSFSSDPSLRDTEKGSRYFGVHLFTYTELEEATNNFDSSKELGEGGFGTVYFGKLQDGRYVAVKRLYENNYRRIEQFMNEVEILTRLVHPNLVTLYGCTSRHSRELLLVYEYLPNGTVADHLHGKRAKPGKLPWHIRMNIAVETASALKYLHISKIIHRDVKTNNILLDNHFRVKVADFGLSRLFPTAVTHISTAPQGTPGYVDPEYHECYQLTNKSDVYSFGVVLAELISSLPAVDITRHRHEINLANMAINKIHNQALHELVDPSLGFETDPKVRKMINAVAELAFQCLQSSKDMRPSMEEVVDTLKDIQSDGKYRSQPEVLDISGSAADDDVVLLKDAPPPPSPDSNTVSKSTTPNPSG